MKRDTRSAYRARGKAMDQIVDAAVRAEKDKQDAAHRAVKGAWAAREAARVRYTRDDLLNAVVVADRSGWHKVLSVNRKTVTVETEYSWTDRIPFGRITDFKENTLLARENTL